MSIITIPIKGMHCRSCEILISEKLHEVPGVKKVEVSYKNKCAILYSKEQHLDMEAVNQAVADAGYEVGEDKPKAWISDNLKDWQDLGVAFIVLLALYFILKALGLSKINVGGGGNPSSLLVVLIVGLTAGISTCMALVGGLVLGISARHSEKHPEAASAQKFRPHIFFNIGRIISYFVLGGVVGLIGSAFQFSGPTLGFLTIVVGIVMLLLGLQLTEAFPRLSSGGLTLPPGIAKFFGIKKHHEKEYSHKNAILVGALTFFLPCGFTQAMQLYAMSTGSFLKGALIMGIFALGTAPGLLSVGGLTSVIRGAFAKKFFKFAGLLVTFLALFNINNGWNLTGWRFGIPLPSFSSNASNSKDSAGTKSSDNGVLEEDGVQIVRMTQDSNGYSPNRFTIKKGLPVKWIVNSTDSNTCAASIFASKIGIKKSLKPGENIIEFTPKETGEIKFTCSMGMYRGYFEVVDNDNAVQQPENGSGPATSQPGKVQTPPTPDSVSGIQTPKTQTPVADDNTNKSDSSSTTTSDIQTIKTTFTLRNDISPNQFEVKVGKPVQVEVDVKEDGEGCMSTIMIPGLVNDPELLEKGKTLRFVFTPAKRGSYQITCAMGVPRGTLKVS